MKRIIAVDLFCGAGGTSSGLRKACDDLRLEPELLAVNHWPIAIETHSRMFPKARHLCASVDAVNPRDAVPGGRVNLLIAAPECTQHSQARGNKPMNDQKRASGWLILRQPQRVLQPASAWRTGHLRLHPPPGCANSRMRCN